jgi:hypothetical protein
MIMVPASFKTAYTKYQKQLILDLSRDITIGLESYLEEDCPNCYFDTMNLGSSATFNDTFIEPITIFAGTTSERTITPISFQRGICPVCRGEGRLSVPNEIIIKARVIWELKQGEPATPVGDAAQDKISLKADAKYFDVVNTALYFIVDGRKILLEDYPIIRSLGGTDGIVEWVCVTSDSSSEIK